MGRRSASTANDLPDELRDFIRKVVGNGVPEGNNGFAIFAVADTNDFGIRGGDGTAEGAGDILADGWDVVNESAIQYTAQPLFNDNDLAADWGVDPIPPLTTPTANRNDADSGINEMIGVFGGIDFSFPNVQIDQIVAISGGSR